MMKLKVLSWKVRGIMSSTVCLLNLLSLTAFDVAVISEHKLKPNYMSNMNSIDSYFKAVSKTDNLNDDYQSTHGKGGISIMYKKSLQYSVHEI